MKRLFYLLFGLVLLPAFLYAQGSLSLKDINDNLTNNYYNKTASDARYATTTYGYSSAEVDILLAPKADKTYVNATDEAIISDNDSQDVQIEANRVAITLKASQTDMDSAEVAINLNNIDDDSQDVAIEANKVGVASLEVGLQTHQNKATGAHAATAISATWTNVQVSLDSIETAIQSIVVGSGFALESWVNSTLETNFYTQAQTNATIEAAIAAIPAPSVNQTVTVQAGEDLSAGDVVSLINSGGTMKAYNIPLTVNTSPNGAEVVFNSAATTYCSAVALDSTRFLVAYKDSDNYPRSIVGTISGSTISWGSESTAFENVTANYVTACKIATDKVLVCYHDSNSSGYLRGIVLTISTATISNGSPANIAADGVSYLYLSLSTLDTDKAILCYFLNEATARTKIITVSGTTPTPYPAAGTAGTEFNAAATSYISVSALSSTSAIVAYQDGGNSNYGTAQVLSISGTTITPGTEYVIKSTNCAYIKCASLTSTLAAVIYTDVGDSFKGYANALSISGTTITVGTGNNFGDMGNPSNLARISNSKFLMGYSDASYNGKSAVGTISGTTTTFGSSYSFNAASTTYISVCNLDSTKSVISYQDTGNSSYGTSVVNTWASSTYASVSGISSGAYSSGSDAVVLISGVSDDQSGLIVGSPYFLRSDFTIGTTPVSLTSSVYSSAATTREIKIGTAKSATELIIGIDYK